MATYQACQVIGLPECRINLAVGYATLIWDPKAADDGRLALRGVSRRGTQIYQGLHGVQAGQWRFPFAYVIMGA